MVWRAGIDLNPLDVRNPDDVAWLEALIWPEQDFRRERLRRAIAVAQADPPLLVAGDLNDQLLALAAQAPSDATLVVFHSAVMAYLDAEARDRFRATMARLAVERGCHWLSNEGHTVILQADGSSVVPEMDDERLRGRFLLLHNGEAGGDHRPARPEPGVAVAGLLPQAPGPSSGYFWMHWPGETALPRPGAWAATGPRSAMVMA